MKPGTPPRILYVEDDADIADVLRFTLETLNGWVVDLAASGAKALVRAETCPPDLILLDVMMPGMDGPSTFAALRELPATRSTPVVFVTAKTRPDDLARLAALGATAVFTKPFDLIDLAQRLDAILNPSDDSFRNEPP